MNHGEINPQCKWDNYLNGIATASKPKVQNPKQSYIFKKRTSFFNLKLQIIRLAKGHWSYVSTHHNNYFCSCTYEKKKTYLASSSFDQRLFFCQFVDRKVVRLIN